MGEQMTTDISKEKDKVMSLTKSMTKSDCTFVFGL